MSAKRAAVGITVAICTYNRAASLGETLGSVAALEDPGVAWELLVVDNNSTDETPRVIEAFASGGRARSVRETRQGLSRARNRALAECRGELLAFIDDDVSVDPGWLRAYAAAAGRHAEAGYFGGPIRPAWPAGRPGWLRDEAMPQIGGLVGHYDRGGEEHAYASGEMHPFGANFAVRRGLWEKIGGFRDDLGVRGAVPGRGEEAEFIARARSARWSGWYVPGASCAHRVQAGHLRLGHLYRYGVQKGVASSLIEGSAAAAGSRVREALHLLRGLGQLAKGRGDRARQCVINAGFERGVRTAAAGRRADRGDMVRS